MLATRGKIFKRRRESRKERKGFAFAIVNYRRENSLQKKKILVNLTSETQGGKKRHGGGFSVFSPDCPPRQIRQGSGTGTGNTFTTATLATVGYSARTRSRRLAASRRGRRRGWASRRQASLASRRRHIVRSAESVECRRVPVVAVQPVRRARGKPASPLLGRTAATGPDDVAGKSLRRTPRGPCPRPGARHRGRETCTRGETPTRWNARIYRRRVHWPCGCSSETESGAVTSGLPAVSREREAKSRGEGEEEASSEGKRLERAKETSPSSSSSSSSSTSVGSARAG